MKMKCVELFRLQPVRIALLLIALIGILFLLKYSGPEPPEKTPSTAVPSPPLPQQAEPKRAQPEQPVVQKKINFDAQCREILYDIQCCMMPFVRPVIEEELIPPADSRREESLPLLVVLLHPVQKKQRIAKAPLPEELIPPRPVLVKPLGKKQRTASPAELIIPVNALRQKSLSRPVILLKPLRKKQQLAAPSEKSVKTDISHLFAGNNQPACREKLRPALLATVAALEARSIRYGVGPLSDCSGIFHRVLTGIKKWCPDYAYPTPERYRDSRDLARWYHERGKLILIKNALAQSDLIRPGMVLFFGRNGAVYKNPSVTTLLSQQHGIHHVGVVVRVHKDRAGRLAGYELFHGHGSRGTKASVTKWHTRNPTRVGYPPLGNGRQQLVAAARIIPAR